MKNLLLKVKLKIIRKHKNNEHKILQKWYYTIAILRLEMDKTSITTRKKLKIMQNIIFHLEGQTKEKNKKEKNLHSIIFTLFNDYYDKNNRLNLYSC